MGKRGAKTALPLSGYWQPVGKHLGNGSGAPEICIASTFEFDAEFFETELLPRFLGQKYDRRENDLPYRLETEELLSSVSVAVLVDASRFDVSQSSQLWDQCPIRVNNGLQHSKITVLAWENVVRLLVGSANLTKPGYCHNREVFAALDFFDSRDSVPLGVLNDALDFVEGVLDWHRGAPGQRGRVAGHVRRLRE
jgi:hypothetical protein